MTPEIMCPEMIIENEIAQGLMHISIAATYSLALRKTTEAVDWPRINKAITESFGSDTLTWIKTRAWDYLDGRREFGT